MKSKTMKCTLAYQMIGLLLISLPYCASAQYDSRRTTIDFVEVINDQWDEVRHYYENNWKVLRKMAVDSNYIESYQILECSTSEDQPFDIMLITTYRDEQQFLARESHFAELIRIKGALNLLNDMQPAAFRKTRFSKEAVRHWR